jgi:LysM repeat protein
MTINRFAIGAKPNKGKTLLTWAARVIVIISILSLGWMFRFRYDRWKDKPVRINRFTGEAEVLTLVGWEALETGPAKPTVDLPQAEVAKLTGQANITDYGWIELEIYNGSKYEVERLSVAVVIPQDNVRREYELYPKSGDVEPKNAGEFHAELGFRLGHGKGFEWSILSAAGTLRRDVSYSIEGSHQRTQKVDPSEQTKRSLEIDFVPEETPPKWEETTPLEEIYTVRFGDTLTSIARNHGTTVRELRSSNALLSDQLVAGQQLRMPRATP